MYHRRSTGEGCSGGARDQRWGEGITVVALVLASHTPVLRRLAAQRWRLSSSTNPPLPGGARGSSLSSPCDSADNNKTTTKQSRRR